MRKYLALPLYTLLLAVSLTGAAQAAPPQPQCAPVDKDDKGAAKATMASPADCFAGEVFVFNGAPLAMATTMVTIPPAMMGGMPTTKTIPLFSCGKITDATKTPPTVDPKICALGDVNDPYQGAPIRAIADAVVAAAKAKAPMGEWDEIVLFSADFGSPNLGPLFYRGQNAMGAQINPVNGIGLAVVPRDPAKPYIGVINAGNLKTAGGTPWTGTFAPCGQPSSLCASGLFSYFDSLAQATANLYGPYLKDPRGPDVVTPPVPPATMPTTTPGPLSHGSTIWSMPASKGDLVTLTGQATTAKVADGPVTYVWNGLLNLDGSILGGNTWQLNGNATWTVTKPPPFQGVSAPFEGAQVPRFHPIDNYVMGFIPANEVPDMRSLMHASAANVYSPIVGSFNANVGPAMGTRITGAAIRNATNVPKSVKFADYVMPSGGDRTPPSTDPTSQRIRQLWVLVSKPGMLTADEIKEQANEVELVQKFRQEYNRYFYTLTGYKGRVHTTVDSNVDDSGYFEFGDGRDDPKEFTAGGGLTMSIKGSEDVLNSGGKQLTVLRVDTPGAQGVVSYNAQARPIKISTDLGEVPNIYTKISSDKSRAGVANMLTVRMRLPSDPFFLEALKKNPQDGGGLFATVNLQGSKNATVRLPTDDNAFLVPDGKFRNYSVNLSDPAFAGGEYTGFSISPSSQQMQGLEIEFIRFSNTAWANLKDTDIDCGKADAPDGWLDAEDNCKAIYNPDQADGNGDGVGDACEDYDGDNVVNKCDNCPTVTNSSQRDSTKGGAGDACDGSKSTDCFFQTSSVGGPVPPSSAVVWVVAFGLCGVVLGAWRRRRRR